MAKPHERFRKFAEWTKHTRSELAAEIGADASFVSQLTLARRWPGRRVANAIERASRRWPGGPIKSEEWDEAEPKRAAKRSTRKAA